MMKLAVAIFITVTSAAQLAQRQEIEKSFENGAQPGIMQLACPKSEPIWKFKGEQVYPATATSTSVSQMFRIGSGGSTLSNAIPTDGTFNGEYLCIDGSGASTGLAYNVRINGTSNLSTGAIVGIVFAVIFAIVIIAVGLWFANKQGYLGGDNAQESYDDKVGNDVEVDDYDRSSHAGRFRNAGQGASLMTGH